MSKCLLKSGFKWTGPKEFDSNRYSSNSSKDSVLEVGLEYSKKEHELHNDYPLAQDEIEIKKEMLSNCQFKITDFYNVSIGNVKRLVLNFFNKEKHVLHYENL